MTAVLTAVRWHLIVVWFPFLWWLVMLSIFSWTCWPFVYLLWKNVYSSPFPIFKLECLGFFFFFLLLSCMNSFYILDINTLSQRWLANIFSCLYLVWKYFLLLSFLSWWFFPFLCKKFLLWCRPTWLFLLWLLVLLVSRPKKPSPRPMLGAFSLCFILSVS